MIRVRNLFVLLCAVLFTTPNNITAQDEGEKRPSLTRLEELKRLRLIDYLELNEEESVRFFAREKEYRQEERNLVKQRRRLLGRLRELTSEEGKEAELQTTINEMKAIEEKMLSTRWDFIGNVADILTPIQRGKILLFEHRFQEEVRKALRGGPSNRRSRKP